MSLKISKNNIDSSKLIPTGIICSLLAISCGQQQPSQESLGLDTDGAIIKSKITITVGSDTTNSPNAALAPLAATTVTTGVTITNSASSYISTDLSGFKGNPLTITKNAITNLGTISIIDLFDNNLKICGSDGDQKCTKAFIRSYTTGTPIPGIYNSDINYGAPLYGGLPNSSPGVATGLPLIGLNTANAAVFQIITIPTTQYVLGMTDFGGSSAIPLIYNFVADFTQAGAGVYKTTLVIEYGISN